MTFGRIRKFLVNLRLPKGHEWEDITFVPASSYSYKCQQCGQVFHSAYQTMNSISNCNLYGVLES